MDLSAKQELVATLLPFALTLIVFLDGFGDPSGSRRF